MSSEGESPQEKKSRLASKKAALEEQNKLVSREKNINADARKEFLDGLTEILAHFMDPNAPPSAKKKGKGSRTPKSPGTGKRTRKDESEEDNELLAAAEHEDVTAVRIENSPAWITNGTMRDYQVEGLNWMISLYENGVNGILADEMGLGKTLQTISLLGYMKNVLGKSGPHIIIVPNSTLANWLKEFNRWCPTLRAFIFHGNKEKRAELKETKLVAGEFDVCITSYEMVLRELTALGKFWWRYLVIDEAHRIKNEDSKLSDAVRVLKTNNRLLLTGTPLQNNLHELWALLNFLMPDLFEHSDTFDRWFEKTKETGEEQSTVGQLHKILKPFLLRRVKADVETALLPKKEVKVFVGLSKMQKDLYRKVLMKDIEAINGVGGKTRLQNICMQLRKVCNHPYLFEGQEAGPPYVEGEHLVTNSGKLMVLDKLLKKLQEQGSRVLIFSQMTRQLDIIEDYMDLRGYQFCRLDGNTDQEVREEQIEAFNEPGSKKFVFLLSTRAGGLGINLATADIVILFDSDWNPQMDLQAMDRAHRIGQKKQVMVYRFVTQDTVEQKIVERAEAKLYLDALVIQQGRLVEKNQNASADELLRMVKFGADTIFQGGDDAGYQLTDQDIDAILALGQQKTDEFNEKLKQADLSLANFSLDTLTNTGSLYEHEGQDFAALQREKNKHLLMTWIAPPKRETKVATYNESHLLNPDMAKRRRRPAGPPTRPPGQPVLLPHQFYPERLYELQKVQTARFLAEYKVKQLEEKLAADPENTSLVKQLADAKKAVPKGLTEAEEAECAELQKRGFSDWKSDHFKAFIRGMELYGRDAIDDIAYEVGLDVSEVKRYHTAFWKNYTKLADADKLLARVKRGEYRREKQKEMIELLQTIFVNVKDPYTEISMSALVGHTLSKDWISQNDLWLLVNAYKVGYGNWSRLQRRISEEPSFSMDWFMLTRTSEDLHERCDHLLKLILKKTTAKAKAKAAAEDASESEAKPKAKRGPPTARGESKVKKSSSSDNNNAGPATESAPKKKKREGPKHAKSAWMFFSSAKRAVIKEESPGLSPAETTQAVSEAWKTISAEDRKKYDALAAADTLRYEREKKQWVAEHPEAAETKKEEPSSASKAVAAVSKYPGLPAAPRTAIKLFNDANKAALREANPSATAGEMRSLLSAAQWKDCDAATKKKFTDQAVAAQKQYKKDLVNWRKKNPLLAKQMDQEEKEKKDAAAKKRLEKKNASKTGGTQGNLDGAIKRTAKEPTETNQPAPEKKAKQTDE